MDLFDYMREKDMEKESPLASRLRPRTLDEVVGQQHIVGKDKLLYRAIQADKLGSIIFTDLREPVRPPWPRSLPIPPVRISGRLTPQWQEKGHGGSSEGGQGQHWHVWKENHLVCG